MAFVVGRDFSHDWTQNLARAVLRFAAVEATRPDGVVREDAVRWLTTPSDDLAWWCQLAGIPMGVCVRLARRQYGRRG
jgi:hypothetical protein